MSDITYFISHYIELISLQFRIIKNKNTYGNKKINHYFGNYIIVNSNIFLM